MSGAVRHFYEFGQFRLDADRHRLLRDSEVVPLSPKAMEALLVLVRNPGKPLEREELMRAVWADSFVEDANLTVAISALRKALGQNGDIAEYVETVPRVGYRFVAPVREVLEEATPLIIEKRTLSRTVIEEEELDSSTPASPGVTTATSPQSSTAINFRSRWKTASVVLGLTVVSVAAVWALRAENSKRASGSNVRSIAVLPFRVVGDPDADHLGLGIADVLITRLSEIRELSIRPTSAIAAFENSTDDSIRTGKKLSVDAVLEGTVFRAADRIRITARLVRISDGSTIWGSEFEKPLKDELSAQDEIALQLVDALALNPSVAEMKALTRRYTRNTDAYQLYIKGRYQWNKRNPDGLAQAERFFRDAIEADPQFALAYVGLADTLATTNSGEVRRALNKALELDPDLGPAHASLGFLEMFREWKWQEAEASFRKAIELDPGYPTAHHWYATLLEIEGRNEEAKAEFRRALEIDPLSYNVLADLGQAYYFAREYDEASAYCRKSLDIYPDFTFAHQYLFDINMKTGLYDAAVTELLMADRSNSLYPTQVSAAAEKAAQESRALNEARYQQIGIKQYLAERATVPPGEAGYYVAARFHALIGEKEKALADLEEAYQGKAFLLAFVKADPVFDSMRADPRYQAILKKMGL